MPIRGLAQARLDRSTDRSGRRGEHAGRFPRHAAHDRCGETAGRAHVQPALAGIADWIRLTDTDLTLPQAAALPDQELEALLRRDTGDIQHAAGSCRMTGFNAADGVVNPDGTVKGIRGLRVADASIMPSDCRANTHFTTVVIGEAIAGMMRRKLEVHQPLPARGERSNARRHGSPI